MAILSIGHHHTWQVIRSDNPISHRISFRNIIIMYLFTIFAPSVLCTNYILYRIYLFSCL